MKRDDTIDTLRFDIEDMEKQVKIKSVAVREIEHEQ
jgi:hypothetical protein